MNTITAYYSFSSSEWDLDLLGINPDLIKHYWTKNDTLHIVFKDGTEREYQPTLVSASEE